MCLSPSNGTMKKGTPETEATPSTPTKGSNRIAQGRRSLSGSRITAPLPLVKGSCLPRLVVCWEAARRKSVKVELCYLSYDWPERFASSPPTAPGSALSTMPNASQLVE